MHKPICTFILPNCSLFYLGIFFFRGHKKRRGQNERQYEQMVQALTSPPSPHQPFTSMKNVWFSQSGNCEKSAVMDENCVCGDSLNETEKMFFVNGFHTFNILQVLLLIICVGTNKPKSTEVLNTVRKKCFSSFLASLFFGNIRTINSLCEDVKGSLTRDFRHQIFFINQCPPGPWVSH